MKRGTRAALPPSPRIAELERDQMLRRAKQEETKQLNAPFRKADEMMRVKFYSDGEPMPPFPLTHRKPKG